MCFYFTICGMINEEFFIDLESENEPEFDYDSLVTLSSERALLPRPPLKEYSQNFIMEIALGLETPESLCVRYDITPLEYLQLSANQTFITDLAHWRQRMADEGLSFKLKARVQAEEYLQEIDNIVTDPTTSKETKLAAISRVVQWGGLDTKPSDTGNAKPSITINITRFSDPDLNSNSVKPETIEIN